MERERWRRIEALYHAARSMPPEVRAHFLATECGGDETLRSEVESLIAQPDSTWTRPDGPGGGESAEILGRRIGHYDVQRLLGAGGMGRVYRARDAKLGRDVALKLLPPEWTGDPDRLARLEREARLLASLNHPNIATIHGIEDGPGVRALVLEFIEGDTLADRIARGPLPPTEALTIARQIRDALDAAHERGIVHRDLKPANIKITPAGLVKVLDFGIATLENGPEGGTPHGSRAPTVTARGTREGVVAGTAPYMSPEQARGLDVDKRTDIWAFGCVLYEMLAGRAAFARPTLTDTFAAIIEREPDWSALPPDTPREIVRLLQRCLEKDRRKRLRDIGDADTESSDAAVARPHPRWWPLAAIGAAIVVSAAVILALRPRSEPPHPIGPLALTLRPPDEYRIVAAPQPSPDGTNLAFVATGPNGRASLWLRGLGDTTAKQLAGTEDAGNPFWSPDGRFIGFAAGERLKKIDVERTSVQTICTCLTGDLSGATWNAEDLIVFAPHNRIALQRVAAAGGLPEPITTLDVTRNENSHRFPVFLPDGRHLLFTARSDVTGNTGVYFLDLTSGERHWLLEAQSQAKYVPSGHLLFVRERTLLAQPFDPTNGRLSGEPRPIVNDVDQTPSSATAAFAISANGEVLTYQGGSQQTRQLVAFDRAGVRRAAFGTEDLWQDMRLSPDGKRTALVKNNESSGNRDIWLMDLASGRPIRWSSHPATDWRPAWAPDSRALLFASDRNGASAIFRRSADGRGTDQLVVEAAGPADGRFPDDWGGGDRIVFMQDLSGGGNEIWVGTASPGGQPKVLVPASPMQGGGRLSPDARWLAYSSNESGALNVYVTSIDGATKHRISQDGGTHPRWRRDGREILYYGADNALMSVPVTLEPSFAAGSPVRLFTTCLSTAPAFYLGNFELAPDGTTLWLCPGSRSQQGHVTVAAGWVAALAR